MKLVKKILAGALSLAIVCGAMFAFVGCNSVKGKTYAYDGMTFTVITKMEEAEGEDKKVTETKTLTLREYYLYSVKNVAIADLGTATLTEEEEKLFTTWAKGQEEMGKSMEIEFKGKEVISRTTVENTLTGASEVSELVAEYSVKDGKITVKALTSDPTKFDQERTYEIQTAYIVDGKLDYRMYRINDAADIEVGKLYYSSIMFAKKK